MSSEEFLSGFDIQYNNITSNQAPGLNIHEICVFLTKAQDEIVKNYFNPKSNKLQEGFDDSAKRQADFSMLMSTEEKSKESSYSGKKIDRRSFVFKFPDTAFIILNEVLSNSIGDPAVYTDYQVIPLKFDEYTRLMSKPYKRPVRSQAWRLINKGDENSGNYTKYAELIAGPELNSTNTTNLKYIVRFIRKPKPIILGSLDGLTINGYCHTSDVGTGETYPFPTSHLNTDGCELDPMLHEEILQRAVELAKIAWTNTGQDNLQAVMQAGQRSE